MFCLATGFSILFYFYSILFYFYFCCLISHNVLRPILLTQQVLICHSCLPILSPHSSCNSPHMGLSSMLTFCSAVIPAVFKFDNSLLLFASLESIIYRKIHAVPTRCQELCQSIGELKIEFLRQMTKAFLYLNVVEIFFKASVLSK